MSEATMVSPFANGTEYMIWTERNCEHCSRRKTCTLAEAIDQAACGGGTVASEVAQAINRPSGWKCPQRHQTAEDKAAQRRNEIENRMDEIDGEIQDLEEERDRLETELAGIEKEFPEPEPPRRVMVAMWRGEPWYTDGYRAIRGNWPGQFEVDGESNVTDKIADLLQAGDRINSPVTPTDMAGEPDDLPLAFLSNGAALRRDWMEELLTAFEGASIHSEGQMGHVVYRDSSGAICALQMPVNAAAHSHGERRPYARPAE